MTVLTDEELVQRCKAELPHISRSYEELVTRHMQRVYTVVYRMVGDREEAEDITQEVFLKVYRGLPKFDQQSSFSTWLYRIATNSSLDALDKVKRQRQYLVRLDARSSSDNHEKEEGDALSGVASTETGPDEQTIRNELRECINHVLRKLDREQARVLLMRDFEDFSYEEIATMLQAGMSAVKMRIHRARLAFRDIFDQFCGKIYLAVSGTTSSSDKGKKENEE